MGETWNKTFDVFDVGIDVGVWKGSAHVDLKAKGRAGLDLGFYVNSGSVDVDYAGSVGYSFVDPTAPGWVEIDTHFNLSGGSLQTTSPNAGAYADVVLENDLDLKGHTKSQWWWEGEASKSHFHEELSFADFSVREEIIAVNRDFDGEVRIMDNSITAAGGAASALRDALTADDAASDGTQSGDGSRMEMETSTGFGVDFSQSEDLLGVKATLSSGVSIEGNREEFGAQRELASLEVTLPDVRLADQTISSSGALSASTDGLSDDDHERTRGVRFDLNATNIAATLSPAFAGMGSVNYSADIGVASAELSVKTIDVSFDTTLYVDQDVEVTPEGKLTFRFDRPVTYYLAYIGPQYGTSVTINPGDYLAVYSDGMPINATPIWDMSATMSNDIGLDLGLGGRLSAFGIDAELDVLGLWNPSFEVGPLLDIPFDIGSLDLGSVYSNDFELSATNLPGPDLSDASILRPFTIGAGFGGDDWQAIYGNAEAARKPTATGDFNNDGYDDIVVGLPHGQVGDQSRAGAVNLLYGGPRGVASRGRWTVSPGTASGSQAHAFFGGAVAVGDFNNDGYDDIVAGAPGQDIAGRQSAGAVFIRDGSTSAAGGTWHQLSQQNTAYTALEAGDYFGAALTVGDFDGDGIDDLAVGSPGEDVGSRVNAGYAEILYGHTEGLHASAALQRAQNFSQATSGVLGSAESGDRMGAALAAGDFNGDGRDDLAIGAPGEDRGSTQDTGAVNVLYGSADGLTSTGDQIIDLHDSSRNQYAEAGDLYGYALAAGDFNGDGKADLAVGAPGEDKGSRADSGYVEVLHGSSEGIDIDDFFGRYGAEEGARMGSALGFLKLNNDNAEDLVVGSPGADVNLQGDAGLVTIHYGNGAKASRILHQDSPGVTGHASPGELFGSSIAIGDYNGDGKADLAVMAEGAYQNQGGINSLFTDDEEILWQQLLRL